MTAWLKNLSFSVRQLRRTPGFTLAAVMVLALGIGLNATLFGLSWSMAFASRSFERPDEVVQLYSHKMSEPDDWRAFSYAAWQQMAARDDIFSGLLALRTGTVGVNERAQGGESRRRLSALVSADYFKTLGVALGQGRGFTMEESRPGSEVAVAIVSYSLWKLTGFDPELVGRTIRVNERPFAVVGITPRGFTGTSSLFGPEIFLPLGVFDSIANASDKRPALELQRPDTFGLSLIGRLKPGLTIETAASGLKLLSASVERAFPVEYEEQQFLARPVPRLVASAAPANEAAVATMAVALLGMTGSVLLIVCLNLASMFLARGQARRREFAIRLALGGGRAGIVGQLMTEGLVLSLVGGGLGVVLGAFAVDALMVALIQRLPVSLALEFGASPATLLGTALFSVAATLIFAVGPALRHSGGDVLASLKQQAGDNSTSRTVAFLPRHPLVAMQIALSLGLLISAGLFIQMARQASAADLGVDPEGMVLIEVDAGLSGYPDAQGINLYAAIEERLRSLPGVRSASVAAAVPFGVRGYGQMVRRAGSGVTSAENARTPAQGQLFGSTWNAVGASYFETMGLKTLRGRAFTDAETRSVGAPLVAVIDDVLARKLWPEGDALGRSIEFEGRSGAAASAPMNIVGVVPVIRDDPFDKVPGSAVYVPFAQGYRGNVYFQTRAGARAGGLIDAVEREVRLAASGVPVFKATTFDRHIAQSLEFWGLRVIVSFFVAMGAAASLIALLGIYGSMSYAVSRRTREIGIRLAIGASPAEVRRMVIGEGLGIGVAGVTFGLVLGAIVGRVMDSLFVDIGAFDTATFTLAPILLLVASAFAAWIPARRATTVNPVTALRAD